MELNDYLTNKIEELMKETHLSQTELAKRSNVPYQSIYKVLKKERPVTLSILGKLAKGFSCEVQDFFPAQKNRKINLSKDEIFNILLETVSIVQEGKFCDELNRAEKRELFETVESFGGWKFLLDYLKEELEIRRKAEKEYDLLKSSIQENMTRSEVSEIKKKMIVSKLILNSTRNS